MNVEKHLKFDQSLLNSLSIGSILGLRTFLGSIALTSLLVGSANVTVSSLLPNVMLGVIFSCVFVSCLSRIPQSVAQPQDGPAVILSTVIASAASQFADSSLTIVMIVNVFCCLSAGCVFWLIGHFKLGNVARLLPYPVVGGFLAGSGLLMLMFAFKPIVHILINSNVTDTIEVNKSAFLTLLFAVLTLQLNKYIRGALAMPLMAIFFTLIVFIYIQLSGMSQHDSIKYGWLIEFTAQEASSLKFPNYLEHIPNVLNIITNDWNQILGVSIVSVVSLLLILSSIELTLHKDLDINHELKIAGISNIASSIFGGLISYTALSATLLSVEKGGKNRFTGITVAVVCGILIFGNLTFIEFIPKPVINGILILMGYGLVKEWLLKNFNKLGFYDYLSILVIAISIAVYGYIGGILIGICLSVAIFVLRYSRIQIIKHELTGKDLQSRVIRSKEQANYIKQNGLKIRVLKVDGYLFFGSVHSILKRIIHLIRNYEVTSVVLDFSLVESVDLAAIETLNRAAVYCHDNNCNFFIANCSPVIFKTILKTANFLNSSNFYHDVDQALECCENMLLELHREGFLKEETRWLDSPRFAELVKFMKVEEYKKNERLFIKGQDATKLYYLDSGLVSIKINDMAGNETRVLTVLPGALIGERSFITKDVHTATAIAEIDSKVLVLSLGDYEKLIQTHPQVIHDLNLHIINTISERLISADHLISVLSVV